jgi:hypothetical protein
MDAGDRTKQDARVEIQHQKYRVTIRAILIHPWITGIQASCLSEMVKEQRAQGRMKIYDF